MSLLLKGALKGSSHACDGSEEGRCHTSADPFGTRVGSAVVVSSLNM